MQTLVIFFYTCDPLFILYLLLTYLQTDADVYLYRYVARGCYWGIVKTLERQLLKVLTGVVTVFRQQ